MCKNPKSEFPRTDFKKPKTGFCFAKLSHVVVFWKICIFKNQLYSAVNRIRFVLSLQKIIIITKAPIGTCYFASIAEANLTSMKEFSFRSYAAKVHKYYEKSSQIVEERPDFVHSVIYLVFACEIFGIRAKLFDLFSDLKTNIWF